MWSSGPYLPGALVTYQINLLSKRLENLEGAIGQDPGYLPSLFLFGVRIVFSSSLNSRKVLPSYSESHFLHCNLSNFFFYLALLLYVHDTWIFIQHLNNFFLQSSFYQGRISFDSLLKQFYENHQLRNEDRVWGRG